MRLIVLGLSLAVAACATVAPVATNPNPPPPPLRAEIIPKPPVTEELLIWQPGSWAWNGSGYGWVPGQFVPRAGHGSLWLEGHWVLRDRWVWVPAHWVSS